MHEKDQENLKIIYSLEEILGNKDHLEDFKNGLCLVFRLCVDDYHRYSYIDDGVQSINNHIKGFLHTVRPIAVENLNVFSQNERDKILFNIDNNVKYSNQDLFFALI